MTNEEAFRIAYEKKVNQRLTDPYAHADGSRECRPASDVDHICEVLHAFGVDHPAFRIPPALRETLARQILEAALADMPTVWEDPAGKGYPCFERPMTPRETRECIDRLSARDGWRLVPIEPIESMLEAAGIYEGGIGLRADATIRRIWASMLSAAPALGLENDPPITWQDVRLYAGEGKLSAQTVLDACNAILRARRT